MSEKKPKCCPFCAGVAELEKMDAALFCVHCTFDKCLAYGPNGKTPDEAIDKWNYRKPIDVELRKRLTLTQGV